MIFKKKSTWLPGQSNPHSKPWQEPGREVNVLLSLESPFLIKTPLEDLLYGFFLAAGAGVLTLMGITMGLPSNVGLLLFCLALAVLLFSCAVWFFVRFRRRQVWRKAYAKRTGSPRVRIWEEISE